MLLVVHRFGELLMYRQRCTIIGNEYARYILLPYIVCYMGMPVTSLYCQYGILLVCVSFAVWLSVKTWGTLNCSVKGCVLDFILYHLTCMLVSINDIVVGSYSAALTSVAYVKPVVMRKHGISTVMLAGLINVVTLHRNLYHNDLVSKISGPWWVFGPFGHEYCIVLLYRLLTIIMVAVYVKRIYMMYYGLTVESSTA